jgi:hypothetical protein
MIFPFVFKFFGTVPHPSFKIIGLLLSPLSFSQIEAAVASPPEMTNLHWMRRDGRIRPELDDEDHHVISFCLKRGFISPPFRSQQIRQAFVKGRTDGQVTGMKQATTWVD